MKFNALGAWIFLKSSLYLVLSIGFGNAFYWRYWRYRDCIAQALSSCYATDEGEYANNATIGGVIWAIPAVFFALLLIINILLWRKRSLKNNQASSQ